MKSFGESKKRSYEMNKCLSLVHLTGSWVAKPHLSESEILKKAAGIVQGQDGELRFGDWNCRAGQNNVIIRTDGTVASCFAMYSASFDWGNIDQLTFNREQLDI